MMQLGDHRALFELWIRKGLRHIANGSAWDARLAKQMQPLVARPRGKRAIENRLELVVMLDAGSIGREPLVRADGVEPCPRKYALSVPMNGGPQCLVSSPRTGCSILMTRAPRSARIIVQ